FVRNSFLITVAVLNAIYKKKISNSNPPEDPPKDIYTPLEFSFDFFLESPIESPFQFFDAPEEDEPISLELPTVEPKKLILKAREAAGEGRHDEAQNLCEAAVEADKLDRTAYYLVPPILIERGESEEASR